MNPNDPLLPGDPQAAPLEVADAGVRMADAGEGNAVNASQALRGGMPPSTVTADGVVSTAPPAGEPLPDAGAAVMAAPSGAKAWDPEKAPAISAAKAAADFVAQIFAEVDAPEASPVALPTAGQDAGEPAPDTMTQPAGQPGVGMAPMQGQNILILGLGASGMAMARWCVRCGAQVTVADTREAPPQLAALQKELPQVRFVAGVFDAHLVEGQGLHGVYRSPGLSPDTIAPVFVAASAIGVATGGELTLYSMALGTLQAAHGYAPAVLAITGTNGKTTVTSLTGQLVERAGKTVAVAGNIGPTLLDTLAAHIDAGTLPQVWVLELSSFQLDGVVGFEPTAAAVLNITQDHLDWHGDMQAYAGAKSRIFGERGVMVLNREDPAVMAMLPPPARPKAAASAAGGDAHAVAGAARAPEPARSRFQKPQQRAHVTFGGDMPRRPGDFGIEMVGGMAWLVRAHESDETRKRGRPADEDLHVQRLMPADALRIRGRHNAINALAAMALACEAGCPLAPMLYGLREYRGEPHRVEPIGVVAGVEYFDDSKGTNVGATVAALTGLGADRRLVVILGGEGKGQDFSPLAAPVARYARAVVLMGRDAPLIRAALQDAGVPLVDAQTLPQAVQLAAQRAHAGDAVLMSPACASFDMFRDYAHRAQVFCDAVRDLAHDAGHELGGLQ